LNQFARKALSTMPRPNPPLTGPMSVQPVEHGSITLMQSRPETSETNKQPKKASRKQPTRADAVRIAKAKISRRGSLSKQRQALKG
jgi:hypothetical protein